MNKNSIIRKKLSFFLLCVELFFIIFSIHIKPFEGIFTLRNIDIGLIVLISIFSPLKNTFRKTREIDKKWIIGMICLLVYVTILMLMNSSEMTGHNSALETFNFLIMVVLLPFFLLKIERDISRWTNAFIVVTLIQALIVIGCFLFPEFKTMIFNMQSWDDDWLYYRVSGLGIAGAGGTVYLYCGFIANCYYLIYYKSKSFYYVSAIVILFATMLVGRTGFYTEVVLLVYTLVSFFLFPQKTSNTSVITKIISLFIAIAILLFAVNYINSSLDVNYDMLESSYSRLNDIVEGNTVKAINSRAIPELTLSTLFFGIGYGKGYTFDGTLIWNDSGFVMRYNGFGAIPALISYFLLFWYLISHLKLIKDKSKRYFWIIPILSMFIIEYKEEFIFYLSLPFVIIIFLKLELYNQLSKSK